MKGQPLATRERLDRWARQQCWRPDFRNAGLDLMLVGACGIVLVLGVGDPVGGVVMADLDFDRLAGRVA
jgi:hypothetical protein